MTIERKPTGKAWRTLKTLNTTSTGVYALKTSTATARRYRVKWTSPDGQTYTRPGGSRAY